jgi:DNA repair exonuclease SbcCD ATPase subunit
LGNEEEIEQKKSEIEKSERDLLRKQKLLEIRDAKYHKFLQQVVMLRGDDNPEEVDRVIGRYDTLAGNNEELQREKNALEAELLHRKKQEKESKEAKKNHIYTLNHRISTLSKKLEKKIEKNNNSKSDVDETIDQSNKTKVTLGQLEMACQNLYHRVTVNGSRIKRVHDNISNEELDMMKMLKVIHDCMSDFLYIVNKEIATLSDEERAKIRAVK